MSIADFQHVSDLTEEDQQAVADVLAERKQGTPRKKMKVSAPKGEISEPAGKAMCSGLCWCWFFNVNEIIGVLSFNSMFSWCCLFASALFASLFFLLFFLVNVTT